LLRGGISQLISEPYEYNTTLKTIFLKTYGEDTFQCPYKDYSSLDRWQAIRDLLSVFTFCNLLSVMTHLRQGKKVSILVLGDVNSGPVASRRGLLEAVPIVWYGLMSIMRRVTTAYPWRVETWECFVATPTRREYVLVTYAALSTQH
jgi:hypothetical protein